jgi:pyruvate formate lyase activating enzyme
VAGRPRSAERKEPEGRDPSRRSCDGAPSGSGTAEFRSRRPWNSEPGITNLRPTTIGIDPPAGARLESHQDEPPEAHLTTDAPAGICFDIQRFSIHDGPGIRTTVFLKGCPLTCPWCHNPEGRTPGPEIHLFPDRCIACGTCHDVCPTDDPARCLRCGECAEKCPADARRLVGRTWNAAELVAEVERDRPFFEQSGGGVTFSGGEPLAQPEFLIACLRGCRERGLHTAIDTCGYANPEILLEVARHTDLFLYDLKILDEEQHLRRTGVPLAPILANLRALDEAGARIWIRTPILPGVNDDDAAIDALATVAAGLSHSPPIHLLPYHRLGLDKAGRLRPEALAATPTESPRAESPAALREEPLAARQAEPFAAPRSERLEAIVGRLAARGLHVKIGG